MEGGDNSSHDKKLICSNEADLELAFNELGEQLGWFEHGSLDAAINVLSARCKKKKKERLQSARNAKKTPARKSSRNEIGTAADDQKSDSKSDKLRLKLKKDRSPLSSDKGGPSLVPSNLTDGRAFSDSVFDLTSPNRHEETTPHDSTRIYRNRGSIIHGCLNLSPILRCSDNDDSYEQLMNRPATAEVRPPAEEIPVVQPPRDVPRLVADSVIYYTCNEGIQSETRDPEVVHGTVLTSPNCQLSGKYDGVNCDGGVCGNVARPVPDSDDDGDVCRKRVLLRTSNKSLSSSCEREMLSNSSYVEVEDRECQTMCLADFTSICTSYACKCLSDLRTERDSGSSGVCNESSNMSSGDRYKSIVRCRASRSSASSNGSVVESGSERYVDVVDSVTQTETGVNRSGANCPDDHNDDASTLSRRINLGCDVDSRLVRTDVVTDDIADDDITNDDHANFETHCLTDDKYPASIGLPYVDNLIDSISSYCNVSAGIEEGHHVESLDSSLPDVLGVIYSADTYEIGSISFKTNSSTLDMNHDNQKSLQSLENGTGDAGSLTTFASQIERVGTKFRNSARISCDDGRSPLAVFDNPSMQLSSGNEIVNEVTVNETVNDRTLHLKDLEFSRFEDEDVQRKTDVSSLTSQDVSMDNGLGDRAGCLDRQSNNVVAVDKSVEDGERGRCRYNDGRIEEVRDGSESAQRDVADGSKSATRSPKVSVVAHTTAITVSSDDDDDDLNAFFSKMKTPLRSRVALPKSDSRDFIVPDDASLSDSSDDECFHVAAKLHTPRMRKPTLPWSTNGTSSDDDDDFVSNDKVFKSPRSVPSKKRDPTSGRRHPASADETPSRTRSRDVRSWNEEQTNDDAKFLSSLGTHSVYKTYFKSKKNELAQKLFSMYNREIFSDKLPSDTAITWNARLVKTAGRCTYKKKTVAGEVVRSCIIELSTKVCDTAERVRDTLIHELCHAAVWMIYGLNEGHGPYWKHWARKSQQTFPCLPLVSRCHSYSISTKYSYRCVNCGYIIGRHSKSLDTLRKVCGHCHGRFELLSNATQQPTTPKTKTPNKFAQFVKDNFGRVRSDNKGTPHKDIMALLSERYGEMKLQEQL